MPKEKEFEDPTYTSGSGSGTGRKSKANDEVRNDLRRQKTMANEAKKRRSIFVGV